MDWKLIQLQLKCWTLQISLCSAVIKSCWKYHKEVIIKRVLNILHAYLNNATEKHTTTHFCGCKIIQKRVSNGARTASTLFDCTLLNQEQELICSDRPAAHMARPSDGERCSVSPLCAAAHSERPNTNGTLMAFSVDTFPTSSPFLPSERPRWQKLPLRRKPARKKTQPEAASQSPELRGCRHGS